MHLRSALVAFLFCVGTPSAILAQELSGNSSVDVDPDSGVVTATCETDLDAEAEGYYNAQVVCSLKDQTGTVVASGQSGDLGGYAEVTLIISGVPGNTYTVTGQHSAQMLLQYVDPDEPVPEPPHYMSYSWDDWLQLSIFGGGDDFFNNYSWFGPGPETPRQTKTVHTGNTHGTAIRWFTATELHNLVNGAQATFAPNCDSKFRTVIGPSYSKTAFFTSLYNTTFNQYPGSLTPQYTTADASTSVTQPGRPINLYADFYLESTASQQTVLTHEGLHHYNGWLDWSDGTPWGAVNNFITKFSNVGYRNTSGTTSDFTTWLTAGCPAAN